MSPNNDTGSEADLRKRAEALVSESEAKAGEPRSLEEAKLLLHEARLSRAVLALENENLRRLNDLAGRKPAYEALRESQDLLALFMRHSPIYAFIKEVTPAESRVLLASDNYEQMIGIHGKDMAGKTMAELFPREFAEKITADDWEVVAKGEVLRLDEDLNGRNYTTIKFPIVQGDKTFLAGYTIDITERKMAEEALKNSEKFIAGILASVDEAFVVIDREYRILSANKAYCEQTGKPPESIIGKYCYEVSHQGSRPCGEPDHVCAYKRTRDTGEPAVALHLHADAKGSRRLVEIKTYAMKDGAGQVQSVIEVINDVTEKKALEDRLRHAQKMESVGTLAGGIAHDFNNILSAIIGYGHVTLMKMEQDDPLRVNIERMLESADRAALLTKGLLTFSRKQIIDRKPVNVNALITKTKALLTRVIGEDVLVSLALADGDLTVVADAGQLEHVFMNLATNARDAMPEGGRYTIETSVMDLDDRFIVTHGYGKPGIYAMVSLKDTGVGMTEETRKKIFEPFFTTKEVGKGTGLGLAMAYGIIKQHEGFINVDSEPGKGSIFRIYLPLAKPEAVEESPPVLPQSIKGGTETIMLAEDDENLRNLTAIVLEQMGYTVIPAKDGAEAVTKFGENSERIRLLLFDLIMPNKNGKEAFEEIRSMKPDIPVIFISGYSHDLLRQKTPLENGFLLLSKPIIPAILLNMVRSVLDGER